MALVSTSLPWLVPKVKFSWRALSLHHLMEASVFARELVVVAFGRVHQICRVGQ